MHGFVLRLESKDILWALRPWFAVVWVDMRHDVGDTVFVVANGFRATVEVTSTVVLSVEVPLAFQSIVAVERDDELDAIPLRVVHDVVQAVQDFIVPSLRSVALEAGKAVDRCALLWRRLACNLSELLLYVRPLKRT